MAEVPIQLPPQAARRYTLGQTTDENAVSRTYVAFDEHEREDVELRVIRTEGITDDDSINQFILQAKVVAGWSHEHIVRTDAPLVEEEFCLVSSSSPLGMSLLENLKIMARANQHFSLWRAARIARDLTKALVFAHDCFPHFAIQPRLVLVTRDETAKLSGFGDHHLLQAVRGKQPDLQSEWMCYASPEMLDKSSSADHRSDQYSVAAMLLEMLTGSPPSDKSGLTDTERVALPKSVVPVLARALAEQPEQRFASMREFGQALDEVAKRKIPWRPLITGAAAVALAIIAVYGVIKYWPQDEPSYQQPSEGVVQSLTDTGSGPLLMPGKKTLHQRILTRPGALIRSTPVANPPPELRTSKLQPFSIYYVYDRKEENGVEWLEIGASSKPPADGWVRIDEAIDWKQALTVAFTNPSGRARTLFFEEEQQLLSVMRSQNPGSEMADLRGAITQGALPKDFPIVAIEPSNHIDISQQFYLLPILNSTEHRIGSGFPARALEVASITMEPPDENLESSPIDTPSSGESQSEAAIRNFKTGIVFVIDSTISMGPYIERTRGAIENIYAKILDAGLIGEVSFGLLAFRDDNRAAPSLEYLTRTFAVLEDGEDPAVLLDKIQSVRPATASSPGFVEDAYAGVLAAIESMNWEDYGGKYIILVTDSGARLSYDPMSSTGMSAGQIRRLALDKGIAIFGLHLLTSAGSSTHAAAARQYETLADFPNAGSLYFPVEGGAVAAFGQVTDMLAETLVAQVMEAKSGHIAEVGDKQNNQGDAERESSNQHNRAISALRQQTAVVGRAMQLAYLGEETGSKAPQLLRAWVTDRDLEQPEVAALDVRILLSKNQLSDLQQALKLIVGAAQSGEGSTKDFFDQLRGAAAMMARSPENVTATEATRLADLNLIGEYLEDLPYQSKIMQIDEDLWTSWSSTEQQAFIDEIGAKIRLYERYHDDVGRWIAVSEDGSPGDAVYPVPLDSLP